VDLDIVLTRGRHERYGIVSEATVVLDRAGRSATFRIYPSTRGIMTRDNLRAVRGYSVEVSRD
jgi:hypothetical protein